MAAPIRNMYTGLMPYASSSASYLAWNAGVNIAVSHHHDDIDIEDQWDHQLVSWRTEGN
jgi:hypothetical protein